MYLRIYVLHMYLRIYVLHMYLRVYVCIHVFCKSISYEEF